MNQDVTCLLRSRTRLSLPGNDQKVPHPRNMHVVIPVVQNESSDRTTSNEVLMLFELVRRLSTFNSSIYPLRSLNQNSLVSLPSARTPILAQSIACINRPTVVIPRAHIFSVVCALFEEQRAKSPSSGPEPTLVPRKSCYKRRIVPFRILELHLRWIELSVENFD